MQLVSQVLSIYPFIIFSSFFWTNFLSTSFSTIQSSSSCFNRGSHPAWSVHNLLLGKWHSTKMLMLEPKFSPRTRLSPGASRPSEGWGRCTRKWPTSYFRATWTQGPDWPADKDQNVHSVRCACALRGRVSTPRSLHDAARTVTVAEHRLVSDYFLSTATALSRPWTTFPLRLCWLTLYVSPSLSPSQLGGLFLWLWGSQSE